MKKIKTFFACLLMAVLSIGQMWGTVFTLSSASQVSQDGITVSFGSGTNTSNSPTWYSEGLRLYANNTITITCNNNNITSVIFNWEKRGNKAFASATASPGSYTHPSAAGNGTWEGEAKSITFTLGSSGQLQLNTFSVSVATGGTPTCAAPTFDPEDGETFEESIDVEISAEDGATIYYTTDGNDPTTSSSVYTTALQFTETTTLKAMASKAGSNNSAVATATYTKIVAIHGYAIDFENDLDAYVDWTFSNIGVRNSITAHGGSNYASNVNSNGNGVGSASITTNAKVATPGVLTFYVSKESSNNKTSAWTVYVSEDNSDWTEVESFTDWLSDNAGGTWHKETVDLSDYTNVYVSIDYSGSTAIRAIDDIELEMASSVAKPEISGEEDFLTSTEVTMSCTTDGAAIYYTTTESAKATPATSGDWNAYDNSNKPSFSATTTVWAAAKKGSDWSGVATKTFTKATILTPSEALAIINGWSSNKTSTEDYYVAGTVSTVTTINVGGTGEYFISDDGTTTDQLQVYKGKWVGGANFTSANQLIEGDDVTIKGKLKKYNSYKELDQNNEVVLYKLKARLAWSEESYEADLSSSNTYPSLTNTNGVSVSYSSTNTDAATINPSTGAISLVAVGSTTIKATFTGNETYKANEVSYTLTVSNSVLRADISFEENGGSDVADLTDQSNLPDPLPTITKAGYNFGGWWTTSDFQAGTEAVAGAAVESTDDIVLYAKWLDPYTVTEALTMIDALADNGETGNVYVSGIVCTAPSNLISGGYLTYYISVDGTETNRLQVYKGKDKNNVAFTDKDDVQKDDQVVVYGPLMKYVSGTTTKPEFNTGNYLYSLSRKEDANLSWGVTSFDAYIGQSNTFPTLTKPNGVTIVYSSTNNTAATIDANTGEITLGTTSNVSTTITATLSGDATYKDDAVSYTLNVYTPANPGTITYEENGGSEVADVETPVENYPDPLPTPEKLHSSFLGWFTTSDFQVGTQVVAGAPMDGDVVLYAKWEDWSVWSYTYSSNVAIGDEDYKVKILKDNSTTEYDEFKAKRYGTGSAAGIATINVPQGTQKLHFHAAGWNNESVTLTVKVGEETYSTTFGTLVRESDISGNKTEYIISTPLDEYYVIDLSGYSISENEVITFTATSGNRFVLFGVNQEGGLVPELDHITITGSATKTEYEVGDSFDPDGLGANAIYTIGGVEQDPVAIDEDDIEWSFDPAIMAANTTSVSVTATYGGKNAQTNVPVTVTVPEPEIILSESELAFSGKQYSPIANKTFDVTLKNVAAATVSISGDDVFSIDQVALATNGTITVSVNSANAGSFSATITVSDDVHAATSRTVALTLTITADEAQAWNAEWVEATELYDGMPILITGVNSTTGKTYAVGAQNSNNRAAVEASVDGNGVLTPGTGTKQFTLEVVDAENNQYAIKTSDGKYLYAAGSGSGKNYLRSQATNDDNGVWTLTTTSAEANGTNTNKYMKFNTSGMFSCYSSGQTAIKLYTPKSYTRTVSGNYGTICLPNGGVLTNGALYEIAYYGETSKKIFFDEVLDGKMEAGVPYIFKPNEGVTTLRVVYTDAANVAEAGHKNGLYGHYDLNNPEEGAEAARKFLTNGDYFLRNNEYWLVDQENRVYVDNYRAYIKLNQINPSEPSLAPGRRRVAMAVHGEQVATGMENVQGDNVQCTKVLINGQLFILRGEKMYDAKGQLVK